MSSPGECKAIGLWTEVEAQMGHAARQGSETNRSALE